MPRLVAAAALILTFALPACGGDEGQKAEARVAVVTTLAVFQDLAREIGGDRVEVFSLLPAAADPHTFEPTPRDIQRVTEADVVFANGLDLEPAALELIERNLRGGRPLIKLAEEAINAGFPPQEGAEEDKPTNPHLWLSVDAVREYVREIRDALALADPAGAEAYNHSYGSYLARLDELDAYVDGKLAPIPADSRWLVSTHGAFAYMADYMGLEVAGVVSESPGQEPSAADIADLQETIEETGVPAVFEEPQLGAEASVLQQAARDLGVEVCTLYSDALSEDVPTYIDLMRFNADEVARCLAG